MVEILFMIIAIDAFFICVIIWSLGFFCAHGYAGGCAIKYFLLIVWYLLGGEDLDSIFLNEIPIKI